jgi:Uma2 family endonuclease
MGQAAKVIPIPDATFEELYQRIRDLPEGVTGEILQPNVLRTMSRPGKRHRHGTRQILRSLEGLDANIGGTGWWIEVEAEVRLPAGRLVVPDLMGYRVERVPDLPDENPLTILPDWACEVFSPSTVSDDVAIKLPLYAQSGIPWIWLVDPMRCIIEVYETIDHRPALTAIARNEERVALPPFGLEFDVGPFWLPKVEEKD